MRTKDQVFLSPRPLPNYKRLVGQAAQAALESLGLTYITVDDNGLTVALCRETKPLHQHYVYVRQIPDMDT